jgi:hypothetical protein
MASCVKLLAVPGPPPGPWDARAWPAENKAIITGAKAKFDSLGIFRDDAMTISCDGNFQKIRTTAYAGFENVVVPNRLAVRARSGGAGTGKRWCAAVSYAGAPEGVAWPMRQRCAVPYIRLRHSHSTGPNR